MQLRNGLRVPRLQNRGRELVFLQQKRHIALGQLQHHCGGHQCPWKEHFGACGGGCGLYRYANEFPTIHLYM